MRFFAAWLAIVLFAGPVFGNELLEPVPMLVAGKPLDVEHLGHAAPFVADFDGDGQKDLLVGEFYRGRLRIYLNLGDSVDPQLLDFHLFQNGDVAGCIHASCCMGFGPQLIDFDGDGIRDVISGNWISQVIIFRGAADGTFAAGEPIKMPDGDRMNVGYGVSAFAVDWDADGDYDLLAGSVERLQEGNVYFICNEGTATQYKFGKPESVMAGTEPINDEHGGAAPVAADWDGDGKWDLILGCGDGSIRWYRNGGSPQEPKFSSFDLLVEPPARGAERGRNAKVCVVDWNEDGHSDLLLGDAGQSFEKELNAEELEWRDEARKQQASLFTRWSRVFAVYRRLATGKPGESEGERLERQQKHATAREELIRLNDTRVRYHDEETSLQPGRQVHGRVWLFLNSAGK